MAGYPYAGFQHGTAGFHDVENGAHGQHTRCVEQYLPADWSPSLTTCDAISSKFVRYYRTSTQWACGQCSFGGGKRHPKRNSWGFRHCAPQRYKRGIQGTLDRCRWWGEFLEVPYWSELYPPTSWLFTSMGAVCFLSFSLVRKASKHPLELLKFGSSWFLMKRVNGFYCLAGLVFSDSICLYIYIYNIGTGNLMNSLLLRFVRGFITDRLILKWIGALLTSTFERHKYVNRLMRAMNKTLVV